MTKLKAMKEPSLSRRDEREGMVRALGDTDRRATPELSMTSRTSRPRYGRNEIYQSTFWYNQGGTAKYGASPLYAGAERFVLPQTGPRPPARGPPDLPSLPGRVRTKIPIRFI